MNLLVVDDNRYVVEGLKDQILALAPEIDQVFGCYSVAQAKELFRAQPIDLLISDIEMPGEDGFALLDWLKQEGIRPVTVLLTSYAEFSYAQRSLAFGVSSYLLKPLDEKALAQTLGQMIETNETRSRERRRMDMGDAWLHRQRRAHADYLRRLLAAAQGGTASAVRMLLAHPPAPLTTAEQLLPAFLRITCGATAWRGELVRYAAENVLLELSQQNHLEYTLLYPLGETEYVLLLRLGQEQTEAQVQQGLDTVLRFFAAFFRDHLDMTVEYRLEDWCALEKLPEALGRKLPGGRAAGDPGPALPPCKADTDAWRRLVLASDLDGLRASVEHYLSQGRHGGMPTDDFLGALQVDWYLMLNSILKEHGSLTVTDLRWEGFSRWVNATPEQLTELLLEDASRVAELLDAESLSSLNVARIRAYIQENIAEVSRGSIAEHFHFSPNYLSKLFRNVEGVSLIHYIQNQRMERAKDLLANSDQTISEIALEIGYPNFSHFSKRFRDFIGCSPNEYRRKARSAGQKGSSK